MHIYSKVDRHISDLFGLEDPVLLQVEQSIREHGLPEHSVSAVQGQFLALLVQLSRARQIIEIGTLGGYSTIWLARALGEDGKLISIEIDPVAAELARDNIRTAQLDHKVTILTGDAVEVLQRMSHADQQEAAKGSAPGNDLPSLRGPVDLFFMDADKPNYIRYFNWAIENSRSGSLILADNVVREGKLLDENSTDPKVIGVRAYCEMLSRDERVSSSILQQVGEKAYDGLAISMVK